MSLYSLTNPPTWHQDAVAGSDGWEDPITGEILVAIPNLVIRNGGVHAKGPAFNPDPLGTWSKASVYNVGDSIDIRLQYPRNVLLLADPRVTLFVGDAPNQMMNVDRISYDPLTADAFHYRLRLSDPSLTGPITFGAQPTSAYLNWHIDSSIFRISAVTPGPLVNGKLGVRFHRKWSGEPSESVAPDANVPLAITYSNGILDVQLATDANGETTTTWQDFYVVVVFMNDVIADMQFFRTDDESSPVLNNQVIPSTDKFVNGIYVNDPLYLTGGSTALSYWDWTAGDVLDIATRQRFEPEAITPDITPMAIPTPPVVSTFDKANYGNGDNINLSMEFPYNVTVTGTPFIQVTNGTNNSYLSYVSGSGTPTLQFSGPVMSGAGPLSFGTSATYGTLDFSNGSSHATFTALDLGSLGTLHGIIIGIPTDTDTGDPLPNQVLNVFINGNGILQVTLATDGSGSPTTTWTDCLSAASGLLGRAGMTVQTSGSTDWLVPSMGYTRQFGGQNVVFTTPTGWAWQTPAMLTNAFDATTSRYTTNDYSNAVLLPSGDFAIGMALSYTDPDPMPTRV